MIFQFVVRRLHWLAHIPGAPQLFDAGLTIATMFFHPARIRAIESVRREIGSWPGLSLSVHRYGGTGFCVGRTVLGHVHGNGLLDVFVGRAAARELTATHLCEPHHILADSAWVSFWIREEKDFDTAIRLMQVALDRVQLQSA